MSDYSIELHAAYEKILSWYQDSPFYLMFEDDLLSAYDYLYGAIKKYVEEPLPDEELSDEVLAERTCIEELTPLVIKDLNSYLPFAVSNPSCEEEEDTVFVMEQTRIKVPSKGLIIELAPGVSFVERNHTFGPVFFLEATSEVMVRPDVLDGETCTRYEWTARLLDVKQIPHPGREEEVDEGYRNRIGDDIFFSLTDSGLGRMYAPTLFQSIEESDTYWYNINRHHFGHGIDR